MTITSVLKLGSTGDQVREFQRILIAAGYDLSPYNDDGNFGEGTHNSTVSWQRERGLPGTGVVDAASVAKIGSPPGQISDPFSEADLNIKFIQAKNYLKVNRTEVKFIILHSMEAAEASTTALNVSNWFASNNAPMASAHFCVTPNTRILCDDFTWKPIGTLNVGQKIWSTEEKAPGLSGRTLQPAEILKYSKRETECFKIYFNDGREITCSKDHKFLGKKGKEPGWSWISAEKLIKNNIICAPLTPWEDLNNYDAGYMAGIFDGEGCWNKIDNLLTYAQNENIVLRKSLELLEKYNINYSIYKRPEKEKVKGAFIVRMSGIQGTLKALGMFKPIRLMIDAAERITGRALRSRIYDNFINVVEIENVGIKEVISIETSTHTYFSEGIVSHNCLDDQEIIQCVKEEDVAYHAKSANRYGIGIEHAGYARQTRDQWLNSFGTQMLKRSAKLTAVLCKKWNIPVKYIDRNGLKNGDSGISTHNECTFAFENGVGHTDVGPGWPMDLYITWVQQCFDDLG